jgi:hypothetical protein
MPEQNQKIPPPILVSVIICDQVIVDKRTNKYTIVGAFENIGAFEYPARHPRLALFCQLTNGRGKTPIRITLVDVQDTDKELGHFDVVESFKDPRLVKNITFDISGIVFPRPGEFRFQIYAGEHLLGERRIICRKLEPKK